MESHQELIQKADENAQTNYRRKSFDIIIMEDQKFQGTSTEKKLQAFPAAAAARSYPPGYRFMPTDHELILDYLQKKVKNEPIPIDEISDVYLKQNNPKVLTETYPKLGENEWYFFTPRDRKYPNGTRPNRAADTGYWKATGADKPVSFQGNIIGFRKALVFYEGKPPKGQKTSWIMHEFRLNQNPRNKRNAHDMRLDDWVLCRIYEKTWRPNNRNRQQGKEVIGDAVDDEIEIINPALQVSRDDKDDAAAAAAAAAAINDDENAPEVVDNNEDVAAFDNLASYWLQSSLTVSPSHFADEPPDLINGHLQSSILDYGLINSFGQLEHNAAAFNGGAASSLINEHDQQAFGFQQGADFSSWPNHGSFHQLPSYFGVGGPTSISNTIATTDVYNSSIMKVEDSFSGTLTNNPHYNQFMPPSKRS